MEHDHEQNQYMYTNLKFVKFINFDIQMWHNVNLILPCVVVSCSVPPTPNNGQRDYRGRNYRARVTFRCNTGYLLTGSSSRTCQSNGQWSGTQPRCVSKLLLIDTNYNGMCSKVLSTHTSIAETIHVYVMDSYFAYIK